MPANNPYGCNTLPLLHPTSFTLCLYFSALWLPWKICLFPYAGGVH